MSLSTWETYSWSILHPCWHFDNSAISKFDDVLLEHGGLLHVLPLAVHLIFFDRQVGGNILSKFSSLGFLVGPLLHA